MMEPEGLVTIDSPMEAEATLAWLEAALKAKGVTVFARIDHTAGAAAVGLSLPATAVLIFGNAQAGTKLMQIDQRIGIDLPLRFLVWTDEAGTTRVSYNDPAWIATRYGIEETTASVITAMRGLLIGLANELSKASRP
jgi:uncharacterized protein (DUF302 family)